MCTFTEWLYGLGFAQTTISVYSRQAERWVAWCAVEGIDPLRPSALDLSGFAQELPLTHASRRQFRSVMRHWLDAHSIDERPPLDAIRVPPKKRYMCRALEPDQAGELAKVSEGWYPEGTAVMFGLYMGLRRHEIAQAEWPRFDREMEWYTVFGKGSVEATVPVHERLRAELEGRVSVYRYVFPGARRNHVSSATIGEWTRKVGRAAGIMDLQPHVLRHTAISTINDATGDLRVTQDFARHASPETTRLYTRVTAQRLVRAVTSLEYVA